MLARKRLVSVIELLFLVALIVGLLAAITMMLWGVFGIWLEVFHA